LLHLRDKLPFLAELSEKWIGFSAQRTLPAWSADPFRGEVPIPSGRPRVVLLVDTFNRWFEPENARAAVAVLEAAGYEVVIAGEESGPPLCCGRTFLAAGLVDQARTEARRMLETLAPYVAAGLPVIGLEPSCLFTLRDEIEALLPGEEARRLAGKAFLFEEFLAREQAAGRAKLPLKALAQKKAMVHGHCHQKAFDAFKPTLALLKQIPGLDVQAIESSCCGMAGAFGYEARHYDVSMKMAELALLPAIRSGGDDALVVADGTSCRHQIADGAGREAVHIARVLERALA
jgi:Fe-S oxidoreductase